MVGMSRKAVSLSSSMRRIPCKQVFRYGTVLLLLLAAYHLSVRDEHRSNDVHSDDRQKEERIPVAPIRAPAADNIGEHNEKETEQTDVRTPEVIRPHMSYKNPLAYGTKGLKENTAALVTTAIREGFRHIVTGGHHAAHNESGVGIGWKDAGLESRSDVFLQTCFVPFSNDKDFQKQPSDPETLPTEIEDQVRFSIASSLKNLQTEYLDALLFHNFRAKRWKDDEILRAWEVMEEYVDIGTIRYLGMTSVHDANWFETFYESVRIKPVIVQNRFHSNRQYDVPMQDIFRSKNIHVQRFWLLNGSSRFGKKNKDMAEAKHVTPAQLMLGFTMSLGDTCLVGTTSQQHMKDDVEISKCYPSLFFKDDGGRKNYANKLGMKQPPDKALPASSEISIRPCRPTTMTTKQP